MVLPINKCCHTLRCNLSGLAFFFAFLADLGIIHSCAVKKVSRRGTRLKSRHGYTSVTQLIAQTLRK